MIQRSWAVASTAVVPWVPSRTDTSRSPAVDADPHRGQVRRRPAPGSAARMPTATAAWRRGRPGPGTDEDEEASEHDQARPEAEERSHDERREHRPGHRPERVGGQEAADGGPAVSRPCAPAISMTSGNAIPRARVAGSMVATARPSSRQSAPYQLAAETYTRPSVKAVEESRRGHDQQAGDAPGGAEQARRRPVPRELPSRQGGAAGKTDQEDEQHDRERIDGVLVDEREHAGPEGLERTGWTGRRGWTTQGQGRALKRIARLAPRGGHARPRMPSRALG